MILKNKKLKLNPIQKIMLRTQQDLLQLISNKKNIGMATWKERQLFDNIQNIIENMYTDTYKTAPSFFELIFRKSKLEKIMRAAGLSSEESAIVNNISDNFVGHILECGHNIYSYLKRIVVETKKQVNKVELNISRQDKLFKDLYVANIQKQGLIAFTDKANKNWTIGNYSDMLIRTSTRMAHNYGILYTYEHIDLYQISKHGSTCKICSPLEGRVYSRSGTHPIYPPLASAFGKINKNGSNELSNTYLNIHPNCLHVLKPFTERGKTKEELERIQKFSNFETNPPTIDKRTDKQRQQYHRKEDGRAKLNNAFKEFQNLKLLHGNNMPKTFNTFLKHKLNNSSQYKLWKNK